MTSFEDFCMRKPDQLFQALLTPLEPQSRFGDKLLENFSALSPKRERSS